MKSRGRQVIVVGITMMVVAAMWQLANRGQSNQQTSESHKPSASSQQLDEYPRQLTCNGKDDLACWSPDGRFIAFRSYRNTSTSPHYYDQENWLRGPYSLDGCELWVIHIDGSGERPLIPVTDTDFDNFVHGLEFCWFPDSQSLSCYVEKGRHKQLWRVFLDGRKQLLASVMAYEYEEGKWSWLDLARPSPNGAKLAMIEGQYDEADKISVDSLYVADADLTNRVLLTEGSVNDYTWTPDGEHILYAKYARDTKSYDLWEVTVADGQTTRICTTSEKEFLISCSPDGNFLTFYRDFRDLYVTPRRTFEPRKLLSGVDHTWWMADSQHLAVTVTKEGHEGAIRTESWIVDLTGNLVQLLAEGDSKVQCVSPDGKRYCYSVLKDVWPEQEWDHPVPDWESSLWIGLVNIP